MKQFKTYRDIRKRALVMGLPLNALAIMMLSVVGSLLVIIFSFSFFMVLLVVVFNGGLFFGMSYLHAHPEVLHLSNPYPKLVTGKPAGLLKNVYQNYQG